MYNLEKIQINLLEDGMVVDNSIGYFSDYTIKQKKDGDNYIDGFLFDGDTQIKIVIWDHGLVEILSNNDLRGKIIVVGGKVGFYQDKPQLILTSIDLYSGDEVTLIDFLKNDLDTESLYLEFQNILDKHLSESGKKLYNLFMEEKEVRFLEEFAANSFHDAQVSGLLHHTLKMLRYGDLLMKNEPRLKEYINHGSDLLFLGIVLHDLGKIDEYELGSYRRNSYLSHRIFGLEYIFELKEEIISMYDEDFYYQLIAIVNGHHDMFGGSEASKTIVTQIVHLIDMLESQVTVMFDKIEKGDVNISSNESISMKKNNSYMNITVN